MLNTAAWSGSSLLAWSNAFTNSIGTLQQRSHGADTICLGQCMCAFALLAIATNFLYSTCQKSISIGPANKLLRSRFSIVSFSSSLRASLFLSLARCERAIFLLLNHSLLNSVGCIYPLCARIWWTWTWSSAAEDEKDENGLDAARCCMDMDMDMHKWKCWIECDRSDLFFFLSVIQGLAVGTHHALNKINIKTYFIYI